MEDPCQSYRIAVSLFMATAGRSTQVESLSRKNVVSFKLVLFQSSASALRDTFRAQMELNRPVRV